MLVGIINIINHKKGGCSELPAKVRVNLTAAKKQVSGIFNNFIHLYIHKESVQSFKSVAMVSPPKQGYIKLEDKITLTQMNSDN